MARVINWAVEGEASKLSPTKATKWARTFS